MLEYNYRLGQLRQVMVTQADVLWRVNNEYRKRLSQAQTFLDLLEQLILTRDSSPHMLEALRYASQQVALLVDEHRDWRYRYYYDSPETKRMVQSDRAVSQALARFNRMRARQQQHLADLYALFDQLPRPDSRLTRVPSGDLWDMAQYAIYNLVDFSGYLNELEQVN